MNASASLSILGDGGWGTALALVLAGNGHRVTVWGHDPAQVAATEAARVNTPFLPGVPLPPEIRFTAEVATAAAADTVVLAIPTKFFPETLARFRGRIAPEATVVSVSKGLRDGRRLSEWAERALGLAPVAALSGPSHAEEVARGTPTAVTVACADPARAARLQALFNGRAFRVYTSDDVPGVELGGALKNVIAIAAGFCDGIGFGDNTKAALMTRGLAEMTRLGVRLGARAETFSGLSGMGDLIVTCCSRHSRNRGVGERIGRGEAVADILSGMRMVAEGVTNCRTAWEAAQELGVDMPITEAVYRVVHEGADPRRAVEELLSRAPRGE
jgi:glycerol-3-phosphate dehydrogenase (NAD(P)+)